MVFQWKSTTLFFFCFFFILTIFFYGKGSQITDKYVNNIFSYETGGHFNSEKPINGFILEKKLYESIAISFTVVSIVTWSIVRLSNFKSIFLNQFFIKCIKFSFYAR